MLLPACMNHMCVGLCWLVNSPTVSWNKYGELVRSCLLVPTCLISSDLFISCRIYFCIPFLYIYFGLHSSFASLSSSKLKLVSWNEFGQGLLRTKMNSTFFCLWLYWMEVDIFTVNTIKKMETQYWYYEKKSSCKLCCK